MEPLAGTGQPARLRAFQRNVKFVGFTVVVCFAASVYLTQTLRAVLIPLVWAAFFALPVTGLISKVEVAILKLKACISGLLLGGGADQHWRGPKIEFVWCGNNSVLATEGPELDEVLRRAGAACCLPVCRPSFFPGVCRRRLQVVSLEQDGTNGDDEDGEPVNRLVLGWQYYVFAAEDVHDEGRDYLDQLSQPRLAEAPGTADAGGTSRRLQLYLDAKRYYPAVVRVPGGASDDGFPRPLRGHLRLAKSSSATWAVAFCAVVVLVLVVIGVWVWLADLGATSLTDNIDNYKRGLEETGQWLSKHFKDWLPDSLWRALQKSGDNFVNNVLPDAVMTVAGSLELAVWNIVIFLIYLFFWVFDPLPLDQSIGKVFKSYLLLKTIVCLLFALWMAGVLKFLECPLWPLFFIMTFLLNYIPEVGSIISASLSVPAVLFNGSLEVEKRVMYTAWLVLFGTAGKIITGNVIEVHMYSRAGGQFMRMHPVILMTMIMLCYALLGITGMFLAIPIVSTIKFYMLTANIPRAFLHPLLLVLEGDTAGPHKNFVDTHRNKDGNGGDSVSRAASPSPSWDLPPALSQRWAPVSEALLPSTADPRNLALPPAGSGALSNHVTA